MGIPVLITLTIDIDETMDNLKDLEKRSRNFSPVWRWAKKSLERSFSENFRAGGSLVGGWDPLDAGYSSWKTENFPGRGKLRISGKLFRSIRNLDGGVNKIEKLSATFGTDVEYAKFHQYGTNKMPARKIVFEPAGFKRELNEKMVDYVVNGKKSMVD